MIQDIHDLIAARLATVTALKYIGTALQDEQQARPDALIWLEQDDEISDDIRELTWGIRLSVNHSETVGAAAESLYDLIDSVRTVLYGWQPAGFKGFQNKSCHVPKIKLTAHETKGPSVYTLYLTLRVFPSAFVKIT
ncbi:MAG: hypothetical protein ACOYB1_18375 [Limnohabitans sp.]